MPEAYPARYYDGRGADSRDATVRVDAAGVHVATAPGDSRTWAFGELRLVRGGPRGEPVQLERRGPPVEVVVVVDQAFLSALRAAMPRGSRLAGSGGLRAGWWLVPAVAALLLAMGLAAWRLGVPAVADLVAANAPAEWERELGDQLVADLAPESSRIRDLVVRAPAERIFDRLSGTGAAGGERARLVLARSDVVNAFAAPGGAIVLTSGLLGAVRSPEELAAVLAHELGHVRERHALRGMLRQVSLRVLVALVAGDQSLLSGALRVAGGLGGLSYSRAFEREADDLAIRALARHGVEPVALSGALESIRRASPGGPGIGFLSTHPAPAGRLARIARLAGTTPVTHAAGPLVGAGEWDAMRAALPAPGSAKATR